MNPPRLVINLRDLNDYRRGFEEVVKWADRLWLYIRDGNTPSGIREVVTVTSDLTLSLADIGTIVRADATAGPIDVILPLASTKSGLWCTIKKVDASANVVTIRTQGGDILEYGATIPLATQGESRDVFAATSTSWETH